MSIKIILFQSQVPVGMSEYQADWFLDEEGHFDGDAAKGKADGSAGEGEGDPGAWQGDEEDDEDMAGRWL